MQAANVQETARHVEDCEEQQPKNDTSHIAKA